MMNGILFIVATPIGNLEDITLRALRVLKDVDVIAAEDTRHTRKLLTRYGISKRLISYWGAKEKVKAEAVIERLTEGENVALVTDSGTPGISDPGEVVIRRAIDEGIEVVAVPGPSAIIAALSISGITAREFVYPGFLPPKRGLRVKMLEELRLEHRTMVLYEAPHRLLDSLNDMYEVFGDRYCAVCHELTKMNEEVMRGRLSDLIEELQHRVIAGEYVLVVEGKTAEGISAEDAVAEVRGLMRKGMRRKEAARKIAQQYGLSQKRLYDESLGKGGTDET
ncbi:MAG TPA: 16S rRNA (cytidine(1402)-2'-O)-methyltransferase [Nitrospirae bacterium]|nr:16S rRNA (cytidine(1402)-2'-O)-methyltransferase [Nitrospirota bacterium]